MVTGQGCGFDDCWFLFPASLCQIEEEINYIYNTYRQTQEVHSANVLSSFIRLVWIIFLINKAHDNESSINSFNTSHNLSIGLTDFLSRALIFT